MTRRLSECWALRRVGWGAWLIALSMTALAACVFDSAELAQKRSCLDDNDCLGERVCVEGLCAYGSQVPAQDASDARDTSDDLRDLDVDDEAADGGPTEPDAALDVADDVADEPPPESDFDEDGVDDAVDNCLDVANPAQEDFDRNGVGDLCQQPERSPLVLTEIMRAPLLGADPAEPWRGQYVEIHNRGDEEVDLEGFTLESGATSMTITQAISVPAGAYVVLSGGAVPGADGVDDVSAWSYGDRLTLATTTAGDIRLTRSVAEHTILYDALTWEANWPWLRGTSLSLREIRPDPRDNNLATSWCSSGRAPRLGVDGGSPGRAHDACVSDAALGCDDGELLTESVVIWGRTDRAGAGNQNHYFNCDGRDNPFDGIDSPESVYRFNLTGAARVRATLSPVPGFSALLYLRSGCALDQLPQQLQCEGGERPRVETTIFDPGTYHLFVDGDDDARDPVGGVFTLELRLEQ